MFDLHCHLLPGIDDGPKTMDVALDMARIASANGITHAVVTPHITPGRYDNNLATITPVFNAYRQALDDNKIQLKIAMAAEVRLDPVILHMVEADSLPVLGEYEGYRLLLLEFPHGNIPPGGLDTAQWLIKRRIKPVIAHPERNRAVMDNPDILEPFIKAGCLLQITAGSLTNVFGSAARKMALKLLERGWVSLVASDAHNLETRPPELEPARLQLEKLLGKKEAQTLVYDRPREMTYCHFSKII